MMDTPIEDAIKRLEKRLQKMRAGDSDAVFTCSGCGKQFEYISNYRDLDRKCSKCWSKTKKLEMQEHVEHLRGSTIIKVEVAEPDPYSPRDIEPLIAAITVKTEDGKEIKLKKPKEVHYIL